MAEPLPDDLRVGPIRTQDEAIKWIKTLHKHGLLFHFDDPPDEVINVRTDERIFRDEDVPLLRARVNELFDFDFDPFAIAIELTNKE